MYNIMEHPEHVTCNISNCLLHLPSSGEGQGEQLLALIVKYHYGFEILFKISYDVCPSPDLPKTIICFIWTEPETKPHMRGLVCIVNFIHGDGILYTVKQFILLFFIVLINFKKLNFGFMIVTMHSTVIRLSRIQSLFIYNFGVLLSVLKSL